ncbi:hypothetical protein [Aquimarina algicola]|uniref:Uncharacterized protein n=1 Tax=Aquimarina algicola TaxID=2589995 RepID=A0A504JK00_9FLAO|nr:hypothetical protein [Aquimarina algicola]TPN86860.1 hypothetical protein FHK87_04455 [Aquimarina algicola]
MTENILSLIIGGGIAIISGGLSHFLNNYFKSKNEKQKYVFEKLEDIIESVSNLEQNFQTDIAGILKLSNPKDGEKILNLTFEQNKLECLVKIYHNDLSKPFFELKNAMNAYHKRKREIINFERNTKIDKEKITNEYNRLVVDFENFIKKSNEFINCLSKYGNKKIK